MNWNDRNERIWRKRTHTHTRSPTCHRSYREGAFMNDGSPAGGGDAEYSWRLLMPTSSCCIGHQSYGEGQNKADSCLKWPSSPSPQTPPTHTHTHPFSHPSDLCAWLRLSSLHATRPICSHTARRVETHTGHGPHTQTCIPRVHALMHTLMHTHRQKYGKKRRCREAVTHFKHANIRTNALTHTHTHTRMSEPNFSFIAHTHRWFGTGWFSSASHVPWTVIGRLMAAC